MRRISEIHPHYHLIVREEDSIYSFWERWGRYSGWNQHRWNANQRLGQRFPSIQSGAHRTEQSSTDQRRWRTAYSRHKAVVSQWRRSQCSLAERHWKVYILRQTERNECHHRLHRRKRFYLPVRQQILDSDSVRRLAAIRGERHQWMDRLSGSDNRRAEQLVDHLAADCSSDWHCCLGWHLCVLCSFIHLACIHFISFILYNEWKRWQQRGGF